MLKDIIEKHTGVLPVSDRINVVDLLTNEGAYDQLKLLFVGMTETCQELEKFEQVGEQLKNESGLVTYLASQGYEDLTIETAGEVAKDVWTTIKKAIKILVDKFILYFNKAKLLIMNILDNTQGKINALRGILNTGPNDPVVKNHYGNDTKVEEKFPMFDNFIEPKYFISLFEILDNTISNLYNLDVSKEFNLDKINVKNESNVVALLDVKPSSLSVIVKEEDTYKRKTIELKSNKHSFGAYVMKKPSLLNLLSECEVFNKGLTTSIKDLTNRVNKLSDIKFVENTENMAKQNKLIQLEISAIKEWLENVTKILKNTVFFIATQVSCYKVNDKDSRLNGGEDTHEHQKEWILKCIEKKWWDKLEEFIQNSKNPSNKINGDLVKMAEEALKNKK